MVLHLDDLSDPQIEHPEVREGTFELGGGLFLLLDLDIGLGLSVEFGEHYLEVDLAVHGDRFVQFRSCGQGGLHGGDACFGDGAGKTHESPDPLGGLGHEGPCHDTQGLHEPEVIVQHPSAFLPVFLDELPGHAGVEVLVAEVGQCHNILDSLLEVADRDVRVVVFEVFGDSICNLRIGFRIGGDLAEVLVGETETPVVEVTEGGDQFVVDFSLQVLPREVGVVEVGHDHREVVSDLLGVELLQHVFDIPGYVGGCRGCGTFPALGELGTAEH